MQADPVSTRVNRVGVEGPELIQALEQEKAEEKAGLF
jgi:hypothetical protein